MIIYDKINTAITKVGEEERYDYIFDTVNANIVYVSETSNDLTELVVEELENGVTENENQDGGHGRSQPRQAHGAGGLAPGFTDMPMAKGVSDLCNEGGSDPVNGHVTEHKIADDNGRGSEMFLSVNSNKENQDHTPGNDVECGLNT